MLEKTEARTSREREGRRRGKKNKRQAQTQNIRKRAETNEHGQISHHAFNVAATSSFPPPGMFFPALYAFLVALLLFK
jgi:hypothetical protein